MRFSRSIELNCHSTQRYNHFWSIIEWLIAEAVEVVAVVVAEVEVEVEGVTEAEVWLSRYNQSPEADVGLWTDQLFFYRF